MAGFKQARWAYLKSQAEQGIKKNRDVPGIIACDKDPKSCNALSDTLKKYTLHNEIRILNDDFFRLTPDDIYRYTGYKRPGLVIINPPYGIRLGTRSNSRNMFITITERLAAIFAGWKFALFSPEKGLIEKCGLNGEKTIIDHGGVKLTLFTGIITNRDNNVF